MSNEFRQIPQAPLHEIDKEGYIQTINKQSQIIPYPLGSNNVKLKMADGTRKPFLVSELVSEIFGTKTVKVEIKNTNKEPVTLIMDDTDHVHEPFEEKHSVPVKEKTPSVLQEKSERAKDTTQMPSSDKMTSSNTDVQKILALDTFDSVKIWKLHNIGISNEEITTLVKAPHISLVEKTLEKYQQKESLRIRAAKVTIK